jgi:thiamine pyrophosphokinase
VFAAGEWVGDDVVRALVKRADVVFACDGALTKCLDQGIRPKTVIGDMDSVEHEVLENHRTSGGHVEVQTSQETNDLEKALAMVEDGGFEMCTVVGATGGDPQHEWANLMACAGSELDITCEGLDHVYRFIKSGEPCSIDLEVGSEFSLFAMPEAHEIHLSGARFELKGSSMTLGSQGVHNVATSPSVELSFTHGRLMLLHPRPAWT